MLESMDSNKKGGEMFIVEIWTDVNGWKNDTTRRFDTRREVRAYLTSWHTECATRVRVREIKERALKKKHVLYVPGRGTFWVARDKFGRHHGYFNPVSKEFDTAAWDFVRDYPRWARLAHADTPLYCY